MGIRGYFSQEAREKRKYIKFRSLVKERKKAESRAKFRKAVQAEHERIAKAEAVARKRSNHGMMSSFIKGASAIQKGAQRYERGELLGPRRRVKSKKKKAVKRKHAKQKHAKRRPRIVIYQ